MTDPTLEPPPVFPLNPPPFSGRSQRAEVGACFDWLRQAWAMLVAAPAVWIGGSLLVLVGMLVLAIVPGIGLFVVNLLTPQLIAGFLALCRRQAAGENAKPGDLLAGFQGQAASGLVTVGLIYSVALWGIGLIAALIVGGGLLDGVAIGRPMGLGVLFGGVLFSLLVSLILSTPLLMAVWFAPALVLFHAMPPWPAMQSSFYACAINGLPLLVYGLLLSVLTFFAVLPVGLGLLVLIPLLFGTLYASYRDIFPES